MKHQVILALLLLFLASGSSAETTATAVEDSVDLYHFFVGLDLRVPHESDFYPLLEVTQHNALIKVDGETVKIPIRKLEDFRMKRETKFSRNFIEVENFSCVPGYSPEADPTFRAMETNSQQESITEEVTDRFGRNLNQIQTLQGKLSVAVDPVDIQILEYQISYFGKDLEASSQQIQSRPSYVTTGKLGNPAYDVINVSLHVKPERAMDNPMLVMILNLKDKADGKVTASWLHFRGMDSISTSGGTISFQESSYPDGKLVDSAELFFFSNGSEIATTMSSKRVDLTENQIRAFANYQYTAQNMSKTLPPLPAWYVLDPKIFRNTDPDLLDATFQLSIDENGIVTQIRTDAALDSYSIAAIQDLMKDLIFYPALDKGNPVTGSLSIRIKDYLL